MGACQSIVRRLQGKLSGESRPEGGLRIVVELRTADPPQENEKTACVVVR
jgi:K+-sensing histidine kinase KdpD